MSRSRSRRDQWRSRPALWKKAANRPVRLGQDRVLLDPPMRLDLKRMEDLNSDRNLDDLKVPLERLMMILMDLDAPKPGGPPEAW